MADKTRIEWTDATWNPVTGCAKVSQGCKHCYAERNWCRLVHMPAFAGRAFTDVACHPERLDQPLRWKKPRRVFVNSMSDLFHEAVPFEFIDQVFAVMALAPQHTFQILTKRAERMRVYFERHFTRHKVGVAAEKWSGRQHPQGFGCDSEVCNMTFPLPNVWLGVSIEDQATANERIPLLLQTPAAVRWVSAEPLLGPVDLTPHLWGRAKPCDDCPEDADCECGWYPRVAVPDETALDWIVVGGESGPKARPMHPHWVRDLRDHCVAAGVPFMFKQWGEWFPTSIGQGGSQLGAWNGDDFMPGWGDIKNPENNMVRAGKRAFGGRLLDGVQHDGYPEVLP